MLEYIKTILKKVSFDRQLFEKELRKALAQLVPEDKRALESWCYAQFRSRYPTVLNQCFGNR